MTDRPVPALTALRMVRELISPQEARHAAVLLVCMLVTALTEVVGIAGLFPLVSVVTQPQLIHTNPWLSSVFDAFGFQGVHQFIVFLGAVFLGLYVLTYACSALTYWLCLRFSLRMSDRLSTALLSSYLRRPFVWLLGHNSTDLTRTVLDDADKLVERFILRGTTMLARAVTALFICAGLLWIDPMVALTTAVALSALYHLIYSYFEGSVDRFGKLRLAANARRYKAVVEALGAVKEARCLHGRRHFVEDFRDPQVLYSRLVAKQRLIGEYPRYFTEMLAVGAIVCVLLFLSAADTNSGRAFPLIGLYIMATWRLVPALQTIYSDLVEIQFYMPLLQRIHAELVDRPHDRSEDEVERLVLRRDIRLRGVSYAYPESAAQAVRDVTLEIPKDAAVALVGATGVGKSTLADIIAGHLTPQSGHVEIDGQPITSTNAGAWQNNIGYVPQDIYVIDDTVRRNVALGLPDERIDHAAVERACRVARVHEFITSLEPGYDTVLGERGVSLSGGQRQRIGIARALYHDPQVLILDEATSSLDNRTEYTVMQAIQELAHKKTLIVIAHRLTTVQACDQVYVLDAGAVVSHGTFFELLETSDHLKALVRPDAPGVLDASEPTAAFGA